MSSRGRRFPFEVGTAGSENVICGMAACRIAAVRHEVARHGSEGVGSGITAKSVAETWLDLNDPTDAAEFTEGLEAFHESLRKPWAYHGRVISGVRARLAEIRAELSHLDRFTHEYESHFKTRDTEAWYVREIDVTARLVELAVEEGRPWEAVARAMQIGELLTELRLKFAWDADAVWGRKQRTSLQDSARARRTSSREQRIADVELEVAAGTKKGQAIRKVAERHGVKEHTIKKDYYSKKPSTTLE